MPRVCWSSIPEAESDRQRCALFGKHSVKRVCSVLFQFLVHSRAIAMFMLLNEIYDSNYLEKPK